MYTYNAGLPRGDVLAIWSTRKLKVLRIHRFLSVCSLDLLPDFLEVSFSLYVCMPLNQIFRSETVKCKAMTILSFRFFMYSLIVIQVLNTFSLQRLWNF